MKKRILIFSLAYYPHHVSGAEVAIKEITDRVSSEEIEFHLITLLFDTRAPRSETIGQVIVHRVGFGSSYLSKILYIPLAVLHARALHKKLHFDALWSVMTYMLFPVVLAKSVGVRVPHLLTLQDGDPYEKVFERWFILPLAPVLDYGFRTAKRVQVISNYLATWPKKRGYSGIVEVIPNGADHNDVLEKTTPNDIAGLKEKLGKKEGEVFLMNTARLVHQKGHDTVIRALPLLPPHISLVLVGGGEEKNELQSLAAALGVENRVRFVGQVSPSEVTTYRKVADIFVAPSRTEGLGNAFLSAMASRVPVIATQVGGLADFLFDAKRNPEKAPTGFAVDVDSPEQIAAQVMYILENPEKVTVVTENARTMVIEKYNWDSIGKEMYARAFTPLLTGK